MLSCASVTSLLAQEILYLQANGLIAFVIIIKAPTYIKQISEGETGKHELTQHKAEDVELYAWL